MENDIGRHSSKGFQRAAQPDSKRKMKDSGCRIEDGEEAFPVYPVKPHRLKSPVVISHPLKWLVMHGFDLLWRASLTELCQAN